MTTECIIDMQELALCLPEIYTDIMQRREDDFREVRVRMVKITSTLAKRFYPYGIADPRYLGPGSARLAWMKEWNEPNSLSSGPGQRADELRSCVRALYYTTTEQLRKRQVLLHAIKIFDNLTIRFLRKNTGSKVRVLTDRRIIYSPHPDQWLTKVRFMKSYPKCELEEMKHYKPFYYLDLNSNKPGEVLVLDDTSPQFTAPEYRSVFVSPFAVGRVLSDEEVMRRDDLPFSVKRGTLTRLYDLMRVIWDELPEYDNHLDEVLENVTPLAMYDWESLCFGPCEREIFAGYTRVHGVVWELLKNEVEIDAAISHQIDLLKSQLGDAPVMASPFAPWPVYSRDFSHTG